MDCDKLLTIFSTPGKLAQLGGVKLAGPEAELLSPCSLLSLLSCPLYIPCVGALTLQGSVAGGGGGLSL